MNPEIKSVLFRIIPFILVIFIIGLRIRQQKINRFDLSLNKPKSYSSFMLWTLGFLAFVLLTEYILFKLGILEADPWDHPLFSSILRITGMVILAPVAEELLFRGLLLNMLIKRKLNLHLAILIQACFFVLLHNFTWQNTLSSNIGIVQSLTDACLFAYARHYTRSLYTPITMHITGNLVATLERFIL
jgi:membrane protease YdiL (CAAX protease family)